MNTLINIIIMAILINYPHNNNATTNISYAPLYETPKTVYPDKMQRPNDVEFNPKNHIIDSLNQIALYREKKHSQLPVAELINENFENSKYQVVHIAANNLNSPFGISSLGVEYSDYPINKNPLGYHLVYTLEVMWNPNCCPLNIFPVRILYRLAPNLMLSYLNLFRDYQYKYECYEPIIMVKQIDRINKK